MSALKQKPLRARRPAIVGPLIRRGVRCGYRLCDVLLGQRPSLHDLLQPSLAFVRSLRRYYAAARLPATVHVGLIAHRLLPPIRLLAAADGNRVSRFSRVKLRCMHGVFDSAGPVARSRWRTPPCCLPAWLTPSAPLDCRFRSSSTSGIPSLHQPLSNASGASLPPPPHGSGSGWFATPFPV